MIVQIFGVKGNSDTRKAERFFSERGIEVHFVNLKEKGLSKGELEKVSCTIPLNRLIDMESKLYKKQNLQYMVFDLREKLLETPLLLRMPIVRFGNQTTVGYKPEVWKEWKE